MLSKKPNPLLGGSNPEIREPFFRTICPTLIKITSKTTELCRTEHCRVHTWLTQKKFFLSIQSRAISPTSPKPEERTTSDLQPPQDTPKESKVSKRPRFRRHSPNLKIQCISY